MKLRIAALVPMRHHSERVPAKNFRIFAGRPLYHHIIETLLVCQTITDVVIDTDSEWIMKDCQEAFPSVRLLERPMHLRGATLPMNDVLFNTVTHAEADLYLQTHSTNPLLRPETINRAVELLLENYPSYDSLFSVTRLQTRLWDALTRPINHNAAILLRTQDLPPVYEENSCLYIFTREILERRHSRIGERPLMFEVDRLEAVDIDEELDFQVAEFLYSKVTEGHL
jgi:CMP-N-acetylneuraminic acid synthetase